MVGTAPNTSDCVAYWKLEDTSDSTGNGNTLTIGGATSTTGIISNGYTLDGSNDYIDVPKNFSSVVDNNYTIVHWVKMGT